jgi:hypothetical protein
MNQGRLRLLGSVCSLVLVGSLAGAGAAQSPPEAFGQQWTQPQEAVQPVILRPGSSFAFDRAFSARIVDASLKPYLVAGGREIPAIGSQQFLVLTLELTNNAPLALAPPVSNIKWLSTCDGMRSIRTDPMTMSINEAPQLGGTASRPISPGALGQVLAIYQVPSSFDPGSVCYTVESDMANRRLGL